MEVASCAQDVSSHAASLMACLNLQRGRAQFCDCVLRQRQSPGQLYPAHRCILAASSPVLAAILASTGALVELQAPCLSDFVLAPLLDYIYTGTLPCTHSQQLYHRLLTTACYLQMDELQQALRAWQQTEAKAADHPPHKDDINAHRTTVNAFSDLPSTSNVDVFRGLEDTSSVQRTTSSLEREAHQYSATVEAFDETQMHSARIYSSIKDVETATSGASSRNGANHCGRADARTLSNVSTCCSILESTDSMNAGDYRKVSYLTPQDLIQDIASTAEVHDMSGMDKEVQKDQFHSAGIAKPQIWQKVTEEELVRATEDRRGSSTGSSSLPHPCCGAVPVICHSSRAAIVQLEEVPAAPPYYPASQAAVSSSRVPASRSASTENERVVKGITTQHKNQHGAQNQDYTHDKKHTVTQSLDYRGSLSPAAMQDKSRADRSDMLKQDYYISSNTDRFILQNNEHVHNGLSHITDHNDQHAHCDSFQNNKHLRDHSLPQNKTWSEALKYKTDLGFDAFPSKHKRLESFECHGVFLATPTEEPSPGPRTVVPLPLEDSDTRSDSCCEDLCPEGEVKEEHGHPRRCPAEMDMQDSCCNLDGPKTDWYSNMCGAETSTEDASSSQHEHPSNNRHEAMDNKRHGAGLCLSVSTNVTGSVSPSGCRTAKSSEPSLTFTMAVDSNMSDTTYSAVGQSYRGHLRYHCLPQEDMHLFHGGADYKHFHPSHSDHSVEWNDDDDDDEGVCTFASPRHSPLKQHFATETTDQVLLLDISTKPAELFVSCKHRSGIEEDWVQPQDTCETEIRSHDGAQRNGPTSVAGAEVTRIRASAKCEAKHPDEAETKAKVGRTTVEDRKSAGQDQSRPGAEVIQRAGAVETGSNTKENQISTWTLSTPPRVPDYVRASMPTTLSDCIPSTLSASMPTNISAHLSTPGHHPFQCSLCDRSFSQRGSLNRHVRSHLGVRPFPCPRCPMTFSRQYRVIEHMRVHQRCALGNDFEKPPASSI